MPVAPRPHANLARIGRYAALFVALCVLLPPPHPASAQEVRRAAIGGGLGVLGGVGITTAVVVIRAKVQNEYLHEPGDLIHWQSAPMLLAPATGVAFGLAGEDALRGSVIGSVTGLVVGSAAGAGLGWLLSEKPKWTWAGGTIGGGLGLAAGGLAGGLIGWLGSDSDAEPGAGEPAPVLLLLRVSL